MSKTILQAAQASAFFQDETGDMFRMQYVDEQENKFLVLNEDAGEETWIDFSEVTKDCKFYTLASVDFEL